MAGEPQPNPKIEINPKSRCVYERDYRTRTNPITGQVEKYDRGHKARWRSQVVEAWKALGVPKFEKHVPLCVIWEFYLTKAKSCKLPFPTGTPDRSNLYYGLENALQGVAYYNDSQIVAGSQNKFWATEANPPGVHIRIGRIDKPANPIDRVWHRMKHG